MKEKEFAQMDLKKVLRKLIQRKGENVADVSTPNQPDTLETESRPELTDKDLEQVQGGSKRTSQGSSHPNVSEIKITHTVDKASNSL
jgi:bacteriocin-like protein